MNLFLVNPNEHNNFIIGRLVLYDEEIGLHKDNLIKLLKHLPKPEEILVRTHSKGFWCWFDIKDEDDLKLLQSYVYLFENAR